jgi:hypothetical protein
MKFIVDANYRASPKSSLNLEQTPDLPTRFLTEFVERQPLTSGANERQVSFTARRMRDKVRKEALLPPR